MGYRKIPTIHTLDAIEGMDGFVVRMRSLKLGEMRRFAAILDSEDERTLDELPSFLARNTVSWNLEDEHGREVPVSAEAYDDLELEDVLNIAGEWMDCMTGPEPELGKGSPSGAQFPGAPVRMEAL